MGVYDSLRLSRSPDRRQSEQTNRLIQQHRQVAEARADRASQQRQQSRSGRTNYTAQAVSYDRTLGVVELKLPDGGRFRARSISSQALIPGQTIPIAILPKGQSIGIADAPPSRC